MDMDEMLKRSKATEILISLLEKPKNVIEIYKSIPGGSLNTLEQRLKDLLEAKLITEENIQSFPPRRILTLTNEGRRVAELAQFMKEFLKASEISERRKWLLSVFNRFKEVKGITRIEKYLFLLKEDLNAPVGKNFYEFIWYKYGPYSSDIARDLYYLELEGLLESEDEVIEGVETPDGKDKVIRRIYTLTELGEETAERVYRELSRDAQDAIDRLEKFHNMRLDELLGYVYNKYAEKFGVELRSKERVEENSSGEKS